MSAFSCDQRKGKRSTILSQPHLRLAPTYRILPHTTERHLYPFGYFGILSLQIARLRSVMGNRLQSIVFDFDYTLADSSKGATDCINYALAEMSLTKVPDDLACSTIGLSLKDAFTVLTGDRDDALARRFSELFNERADKTMIELTVLYDWVPTALISLKDHGFSLGIVSNKYGRRIRSILRREKMLDFFDVIVGGEDVSEHKPHPEGLLKAMEALSARPSNAIYVGDSVVDAELADRAGVPFIAVLSGVTPKDAFSDRRVVAVIDSIEDLLGAIASSFDR